MVQWIETITKAVVWDSSELFENLSTRVKRSALLLSAAITKLSSAALGSNTGVFAHLYSLKMNNSVFIWWPPNIDSMKKFCRVARTLCSDFGGIY